MLFCLLTSIFSGCISLNDEEKKFVGKWQQTSAFGSPIANDMSSILIFQENKKFSYRFVGQIVGLNEWKVVDKELIVGYDGNDLFYSKYVFDTYNRVTFTSGYLSGLTFTKVGD